MAFKKSITTADGVTHADAYFKVQAPRIDHTAKIVKFGLMAWHDQAARNDGKASLEGVPTVQNFRVAGSVYDTWFSESVLKADGKSAISQAYLYARAQADYTDALDIDPDE